MKRKPSEELTQIAIYELVRQTAQTIALVATRDDAYVPIPNIDDIMMGELTAALTERGLPAQIAADLLGISRRTFFRKRDEVETEFRHSHVTEVLAVLSEGAATKEALFEELHFLDAMALRSALRFLENRGLISSKDGVISLQEPTSEHGELTEYVEVLAAEDFPIDIAELAKKLGQPKTLVRNALQSLEQTGQLTLGNDQIVQVNDVPDFAAITPAATTISLLMTFRVFFDTLRRRLAYGREKNRILMWHFSDADYPTLDRLITQFKRKVDTEWEKTEPDTRVETSRFRMFLGWSSDE